MQKLVSTVFYSTEVCNDLGALHFSSSFKNDINLDGEWVSSIVDDYLYLSPADWDAPKSIERRLVEMTGLQCTARQYKDSFQTGSKALWDAQCRDQSQTWLPLLQKAFAKAHGDYRSLDGGSGGYVKLPKLQNNIRQRPDCQNSIMETKSSDRDGVADFTGGVTTMIYSSDILNIDRSWNTLRDRESGFLITCATSGLKSEDSSGMHVYSVLDTKELASANKRLVHLQ
jgi:hypothetical protein